MKIFGWMQNKLIGSKGKKKTSSVSAISDYKLHEPCKQEFSDWPQALLAIGTFGNNNLKEDIASRTKTTAEDSSSFQDEDVGNLLNELSIYCLGQVKSNLAAEQEENTNNLINKSLKFEAKENDTPSDSSNIKSRSLVCSKGNCSLDKKKSAVNKKLLFLLLKKMFASNCKSGFQPTPILKDLHSKDSRMEKILRAILYKKVYPQGSCSKMFVKKNQETRLMSKSDDDDDDEEEELATGAGNGSKWVKTDSEYIVLEI